MGPEWGHLGALQVHYVHPGVTSHQTTGRAIPCNRKGLQENAADFRWCRRRDLNPH